MFLLVFLLCAFSAWSQVTVTNGYPIDIELSTSSGGPVILRQNESKNISFVENGKENNFRIRSKSGNSYKVEKITLKVTDNKITLKPGMEPATNPDDNNRKNSIRTEAKSDQNASSSLDNLKTGAKQRISLENGSKHRFVIVGPSKDPMVGIAIKPGQTSGVIESTTGLKQLTALVDLDEEGQSTGKNFGQAVIKLIVVQDQDKIVVKEENITAITSGSITVRFKSLFPYKVVFVSGPLAGKAMKQHSFLKGKYAFNTGFNTLSIQYFLNGIRYQSDAEFIVAEGEKVVTIGAFNLKNTVALEGGYSAF